MVHVKIRLQLELPEDFNWVSYSQSLMPRRMGGPAELPVHLGPAEGCGCPLRTLAASIVLNWRWCLPLATRSCFLIINYHLFGFIITNLVCCGLFA